MVKRTVSDKAVALLGGAQQGCQCCVVSPGVYLGQKSYPEPSRGVEGFEIVYISDSILRSYSFSASSRAQCIHSPIDMPSSLREKDPYVKDVQSSTLATKTHALSVTPARPLSAPKYFMSRRKAKGEVEKQWLEKKDPRQKWLTLFPLIGLIIGFVLSGYLVYDGLASIETPEYCTVYEDTFATGFDEKIWTKEVEVGGFGNGQFDETTNTDENVFIKDGILTIKPTLQDAHLIEANNVINLTADGLCTSDEWNSCIVSTNTTNGTIVNPAKSARINTRKGASIQYGRVEVVAKMPRGDWLWPAIWMLPVNNTFGPWPMSGEVRVAFDDDLTRAHRPRLILPNRGGTTGLTQWEGTTSSVQLFIGDLILPMMPGGEPTPGRMLCIPTIRTHFVRAHGL